MEIEKRPCSECGKKALVKTNVSENFSTPWKDYKSVPVVVELEIFVCNSCGNYALSSEDLRKIDQAAESSVRIWTRMFIDSILKKSHFKQHKLAEYLGLSSVYLSELRQEKRTPKFQLWNILKIVALDPDQTLQKLNPQYVIRRKDLDQAS